jgi:hypothetical protein
MKKSAALLATSLLTGVLSATLAAAPAQASTTSASTIGPVEVSGPLPHGAHVRITDLSVRHGDVKKKHLDVIQYEVEFWTDDAKKLRRPSVTQAVKRCRTKPNANQQDLSKCRDGWENEGLTVEETQWSPEGVAEGGTGHYYFKGHADADLGRYTYGLWITPHVQRLNPVPYNPTEITGTILRTFKVLNVTNPLNVVHNGGQVGGAIGRAGKRL